MKQICFILIALSVILPGCTAFRSMKYGTPSYDTYRNFVVDTISSDATVGRVLISSAEHDGYFEDSKFEGRRINNETILDYFSRERQWRATDCTQRHSVSWLRFEKQLGRNTYSNKV